MFRGYITVGLLWVFCTISCDRRGGAQPLENTDSLAIESGVYWNRPRKLPLAGRADSLTASWPAFVEWDRSFDLLLRSGNEEELKLAVKDLLEKEAAMAKQRYPVPFDKAEVKSRQKVIRTFLLKLQWELDQRDSVTTTMDQLGDSYNAFREKLNYILLNPLDSIQVQPR